MRIIFCIILCLTLSIRGEAQSFEPFIKNIREYNRTTPQERVFLDLDCKDGCYIGDTIHFSACVVRADSLCPSRKSGILYVELVNPIKTIVERCKLQLDSLGKASGTLVVDSMLESGFYQVRAYTRYQTNWSSLRPFSRVVPVYYPDSLISQKDKKKNKGAGFINLSHSAFGKKSKGKDLRTFMYVESGSFGINEPTRIAIHATDNGGRPAQATYTLRDIYRSVVAKCELDRYGNGVLEFIPYRISKMKVEAKGKSGKSVYEIPRYKPTGLSLKLDNLDDDYVRVRMSRSKDNENNKYCTIILNRGNLVYCDSVIMDTTFLDFHIHKKRLGRGVNEFIVFSDDGKQMARRRFFKGTINSDEEQWVLLDSELAERNQLPLGAYKTLTAEEIDHLLLVDETFVFPWYEMASQPQVTMSQPEEKELLVFGRVVPTSITPNATPKQLDDESFVLTLNQGETIYKSVATCDRNGFFGSYFPGLKGEWMLMAHHKKGLERHKVLIFENFSPKINNPDIKDLQPELFGKTKWVSPKMKRVDGVFYDCDALTKYIMAEGQISRNFYRWLGGRNKNLKKTKGPVSPVIVNILPDSAFNKHIDFNFFGTSSDDPRTVAVDGPTYNGRPIVWIIDGQYRMVTGLNKMITDFTVLRPCKRHMPNFVDEVKSVFITEEPTAFHPYMRCSVLESKKPVTVFITLHKNYIWNDSGLVTAPFQGVE